jgi:hypothetical protein
MIMMSSMMLKENSGATLQVNMGGARARNAHLSYLSDSGASPGIKARI